MADIQEEKTEPTPEELKAKAKRRREQKNESQNRINAEKRDIGDLPSAPTGKLAEDRKKCDESLLFFLERVFPLIFSLEWSEDHLRLIGEIERIGMGKGGSLLKAIAMPRGSGKTSILVAAVIWLILTRHRRFAVIVAATAGKAKDLLKGIKVQILHNRHLHDLYPQELHALRRLKGEGKKAAAQTSNGKLTGVEWNTEQIGFGVVEGCPMQGAGIAAVGLTSGNIRGQQLTLPTGEVIRPDLAIPDDPQTKASAKSPAQVQTRYELLMGDVLGMAGPNKRIAALCACTVVYQGDLADRLLDRDENPEWQGERCKMVYEWPTNEELWDEYREIRHAELRVGGDGSKANQFVRDNFEKLHKGSRVGWEARTGGGDANDDGEVAECLSALQYAYDLKFRDEATFFAEFQNEPLSSLVAKRFDLKAEEIAERVNGVPEGVIPTGCEKITGMIDVQGDVLFFILVAWESSSRGHIIRYGTWPDQKRRYFTKRSLTKTYQRATGTGVFNEALYSALESLSEELMETTFERTDGALMQIDRLAVDARWGRSTRVVRRFCRECKWVGKIMPLMGQYIGAKKRPWDFWNHNKTHKLGVHCRIQPPPAGQPGVREILVDSNWWRSWVAERLTLGKGSDKAILLYKATPTRHKLVSEHLSSEEGIEHEDDHGNVVIEWSVKTGRDNDLWDCLVGAAVLGHIEGVPVEDGTSRLNKRTKKARKRRKISNLAC